MGIDSVSSFVSQFISNTLEDDPHTTRTQHVAAELLHNQDSILRAPINQSFWSRFVHFLRNTFCTASWCEYKDVKDNLRFISESLANQPPITLDVKDVHRHISLRQKCHGTDIQTLFNEQLNNTIKPIKDKAKRDQLALLIQTITKSIKIQEAEDVEQIKEAAKAIEAPSADLAAIRDTLMDMQKTLLSPSAQEELEFSLARLTQKEELKNKLSEARSIQGLNQLASNARILFEPPTKYQQELTEVFERDLKLLVEQQSEALVKEFKNKSLEQIARMRSANSFVQEHEELLQAFKAITPPPNFTLSKKAQNTLHEVSSKYLDCVKTHMTAALNQLDQNSILPALTFLSLLKTTLTDFNDFAEQCRETREIKTTCSDLIREVDRHITRAQVELDRPENKELLKELQDGMKGKTVTTTIGGKTRNVTQLWNTPLLGVIVSMARWTPIVGPATKLIPTEATPGQQIAGGMLAIAALTAYVALSEGYSLSTTGLFTAGQVAVGYMIPHFMAVGVTSNIPDWIPGSTLIKMSLGGVASFLSLTYLTPEASYTLHLRAKTTGWGLLGHSAAACAKVFHTVTGWKTM